MPRLGCEQRSRQCCDTSVRLQASDEPLADLNPNDEGLLFCRFRKDQATPHEIAEQTASTFLKQCAATPQSPCLTRKDLHPQRPRSASGHPHTFKDVRRLVERVMPYEPQTPGRAELEHRVPTRARMTANPQPVSARQDRRPLHSDGPCLRSRHMRAVIVELRRQTAHDLTAIRV